MLDDDHDTAERLRAELRTLNDDTLAPGRTAVDMAFLGQALIARDDPTELASFHIPGHFPGQANPVALAVMGYASARTGDQAKAVTCARAALRHLDSESSYLLTATRIAAVADAAGDDALARDCIGILTPWAEHVAVDANGWWCDGPVALWLAVLHARRGQFVEAVRYLEQGEATARRLNDVRSLRRAEALRIALPSSASLNVLTVDHLTPRERSVLEALATGATNVQIARALAFSVSTIRNDTMSIYRKLGVTGRAEAVAHARACRLLTTSSER